MKKRVLLIVILFFLCFCTCQVVQAKVIVKDVKAGDSSTWSLTDDGIMWFRGTGSIYINYDSFEYSEQCKIA